MSRTASPSVLRTLSLACAALALAGCASMSADGGFAPLQQAAREHLGKDLQRARSDDERNRIDTRVAELLAKPLDADAAVQLALLNNRALQASFEELGIAEADLVRASRLPNPGFGFARLSRGDEREIERRLSFDLGRLLLLPLAREVEGRRFAAAQRDVTLQLLALAAQARKAWVDAVAADERLRYTQQVQRAADASAELARRMAQVGNFSTLQRLREQAFYADATLKLARAQQAQVAARERLTRLLGLWGEQLAYTLPERLPELPGEPAERPDIERQALAQRLDVRAAKLHAEATARNLGLTKATRVVDVLEFAVERNSSNQAPRQTGYEIGVELPLFDWGGARVAKAESLYRQSAQRAAQVAIDARSEVREAYHAWRTAYDIARHYRDEIVPNAKRISDENLLRYNGMLIGVFELLADARAQIASVDASIDALRDFWVAQADLELAMLGKPSLDAGMPAATPASAEPSGAH